MRFVVIMGIVALLAGCNPAPPAVPMPSYRGDVSIVARALLGRDLHYRALARRGALFLDDSLMRCEPRDTSPDIAAGGIEPPISDATCTIKPVLHDVTALTPWPVHIDIQPPNPRQVQPGSGPQGPPPATITLDLSVFPVVVEDRASEIWMTIRIEVPRGVFEKLNEAPYAGNMRVGFLDLLKRYEKQIVVRAFELRRDESSGA